VSDYYPGDVEEQRRVWALERAQEHASPYATAAQLVEDSRKFEAYAKGRYEEYTKGEGADAADHGG
jgi:hypothetical protein